VGTEYLSTKNLLIGSRELDLIASALAKCELSGNNQTTADYEEKLAAFFGMSATVACSSGRGGLLMSLLLHWRLLFRQHSSRASASIERKRGESERCILGFSDGRPIHQRPLGLSRMRRASSLAWRASASPTPSAIKPRPISGRRLCQLNRKTQLRESDFETHRYRPPPSG
jgi:hypothetical protein